MGDSSGFGGTNGGVDEVAAKFWHGLNCNPAGEMTVVCQPLAIAARGREGFCVVRNNFGSVGQALLGPISLNFWPHRSEQR